MTIEVTLNNSEYIDVHGKTPRKQEVGIWIFRMEVRRMLDGAENVTKLKNVIESREVGFERAVYEATAKFLSLLYSAKLDTPSLVSATLFTQP